MIYSERPGAASPWRALDDAMRSIHEDQRRLNREETEKRKANGIPLSDAEGAQPGDNEYADPGDYVPRFPGVDVRIKLVSKEDVREFIGRVSESQRAAGGDGVFSMASVAKDRATKAIMFDFVASTIVGVRGLRDDEGEYSLPMHGDELSPDDLRSIDAAGLLQPLASVAQTFQFLDGEARKNFGRSQP